MIYQKVPGESGQPRSKCPFFNSIATHGAVKPDKYFLGQILGIIGRAGKPIAQVIDSPVVHTHNLLPCPGIPGQAATHKCPCLWFFQAISPMLVRSL
jgi:hypothetical protein